MAASTQPSPPTGVTGTLLASDATGAAVTASAPFGHALVAAAERDPRILGLTADLRKYTDLHVFAERFPACAFSSICDERTFTNANSAAMTAFVGPLQTQLR